MPVFAFKNLAAILREKKCRGKKTGKQYEQPCAEERAIIVGALAGRTALMVWTKCRMAVHNRIRMIV